MQAALWSPLDWPQVRYHLLPGRPIDVGAVLRGLGKRVGP